LPERNPVSERITIARIQTKVGKISMVQYNAPTANAELAEKVEFTAFWIKPY